MSENLSPTAWLPSFKFVPAVTLTSIVAGAVTTATAHGFSVNDPFVFGGTASVAEVTTADFTGITDAVDGTSFLLHDNAGSVGVWFNKDGAGVDPMSGDRMIAVPIATGDSATVIATAAKTAIDADSQFTATIVGTLVTITNVQLGVQTDAADVDSTVVIVTTVQGKTAPTNGTVYFINTAGTATTFTYAATSGGIAITSTDSTTGVCAHFPAVTGNAIQIDIADLTELLASEADPSTGSIVKVLFRLLGALQTVYTPLPASDRPVAMTLTPSQDVISGSLSTLNRRYNAGFTIDIGEVNINT